MADWKSRAVEVEETSVPDWQKRAEAVTEAPGYLESLVRGGAQGATFGFADELTGAAEAAKDIALGTPTLDDFNELRKQHTAESRADYKAAEAENPLTSLLGNLGGGFATGGPITKGALALGGKAIPAATTLGQKVLGGIGTGAAVGGLTGAGTSEATTASGLAQDVGMGVGLGAFTGAAIPVIGGAGKAGALGTGLGALAGGTGTDDRTPTGILSGALGGGLAGGLTGAAAGAVGSKGVSMAKAAPKEILTIGDITEFFKRGTQRKSNLALKTAQEEQAAKFSQDLTNIAKELGGKLDQEASVQQASIKQATESGTTIDLNELLDSFLVKAEKDVDNFKIDPKNLAEVRKEAEKLTNTSLTPEQLYNERSLIYANEYEKARTMQSGNPLMKEFAHELTEILKNKTPGLREADKKLSILSDAINQTGDPTIIKSIPPEFRKEGTKELGNLAQAFDEKVDYKNVELIDNFANTLKQYDEKLSNKITTDLEKSGKEYGLAQRAGQQTLPTGKLSRFFGSILTYAKGGAHTAGGTIADVGEGINKLMSYTPDKIKQLAQKIKSGSAPGDESEKLADILSSVGEKDRIGRNALLFSIEQNPVYRSIINASEKEEDGKQIQ